MHSSTTFRIRAAFVTIAVIAFWHATPALTQPATERAELESRCEEEHATARLEKTTEGGFAGMSSALGGDEGPIGRLNKILQSNFNDRDITSYAEGLKTVSGFNRTIQAHHIVEQRHIKMLGKLLGWDKERVQKELRESPAVILTAAEHECFSNELDFELPKGHEYDRSAVEEAYSKAYANEPNWYKAAKDYLDKTWPPGASPLSL
ncbi:MAG: hypothetical protein ABR567_01335 [Myxococcales bacterium]|nr:hypothetical protein [Myxococcales bacterium]